MRSRWFVFVSLAVLLSLIPLAIQSNRARNLSSGATQSSMPAELVFPGITIDRIFSSDHSLPSGAKPEDLRTVIVTGDVIPAREGNYVVLQKKDFNYPWEETASFLKQADLRVINLEASLSPECPILHSGFTLCGDPRHIEGLKFAGIDLVGLENNHITNLGPTGLKEIENLLTTNGIDWARRDKLAIKEIRGIKFGLLAWNGIGEKIDREQMQEEIRAARPQVDVLMALFHWGKEYERLPLTDGSIAPDDPREIAHLAIDSGVDLVLGNHPHWFQAVEIYKGHVIPYAHGNFIFDQMWSEETRLGMIGKYTFYKTKLVDVSFTPVKIYDYVQPRFLDAASSSAQLKIMKQASEDLAKLDSH